MWGRPSGTLWDISKSVYFCPLVPLGPLGGFSTDEITLYVEMFIDPSSSLYFISDSNELETFWLLVISSEAKLSAYLFKNTLLLGFLLGEL